MPSEGTGPDPDVILRPARHDDLPHVAEVHLRARAASPMPPSPHEPDEVRVWVAGWDLETQEVWVAEDAGTGDVVGYARLHRDWLDDLYVDPARRRTGIGSALLSLVTGLRPHGFCLWVFEANAPARAFYAQHGLLELEHTDGSANEERAPDVRLAWPGTDPVAFLRGLVDEVDAELGDLLARRAALTRVIQEHKADTTRDPRRERAIAAAMARRAPALGEERLGRIMHQVITESLDAAGREQPPPAESSSDNPKS